MTNPFFANGKKRDQVFAVDLGGRTTKAVLLNRNQDKFTLSRYTILDAPIYEKGLPQGLLTEHLRAVIKSLEPKTKQLTLAIGSGDSILRQAEMPVLPINDMRQMLRLNPKYYLQQDLTDYVFDCWVAPTRNKPAEPGKSATPKFKTWVGGARRDWLSNVEGGIKAAGLIPDQVTLTVLGPINALELSLPEVFEKEVTAIVDLGFKASTVSIIADGELCLTRAVEIGGDRLTAGLAEAMGITYAEAEGIKIGMPQEVEAHLQPLLAPLGRELRASIDFFEHQADKTVSQVFVCGGAARSDFILQMLQSELIVPCKSWNPVGNLEMQLQPQQAAEVEQVASQLAVAIGAATMAFN
jgi:type IV pilus assembly protein PilM